MEQYECNQSMITIIDTGLNLTFNEPYNSLQIPQHPVDNQLLKESSVRVIKDEEGTVEEAYLISNDLLDGQYLLFYPSGKWKMEQYYSQGLLHGPATFFSEEGNILAKSWYIKGKRQGKCYWYYSSKALYSIQQFIEDLPHGKQEYFYEDGTPKSILPYKNGLLDGNVVLYSPDGSIEREYHYVQGRRVEN